MRRAVLFGSATVVVLSVAAAAGTASAAPAGSARKLSAKIAMSGHPEAASPARFTLSESLPSGDRSVSYRVTFGDVSTAAHGKTPPKTLTHRYAKPGRYTVVLTVSDKRHVSLREHTTVVITAPPAKGAATVAVVAPATTAPPATAPAAPAPAPGTTPAPSTTPPAPPTTPTPAPLPSGPLSSDALISALATDGVTAVAQQVQETGLLALRITIATPVSPPAWSGDTSTPTGTTSASGWIVWPDGARPTGLVLYAHGCCGTPANLEDEAAAVAAPTGAVVVAMDYRDSSDYAPDLASEDSASAVADLQAALPEIGETVAYGDSEGGAVTGLMIEHHPGLVDDWVDNAGPVDLPTSAALWQQELDDKASEGPAIDTGQAQTLLNLYTAAVGSPPDTTRASDLSPIDHIAPLAGSRLRQAFVIHATGDAVVSYTNADEVSTALVKAGIPTSLLKLVPAAGQPDNASDYHMTAQGQADAVNAVKVALTRTSPASTGLTTTQETITAY